MNTKKRTLSTLAVATSLVSIHYGLGFLIGSGESVAQQGSLGILYALSSALGILSLIFISSFYWDRQKPIWDLMGRRYGHFVRRLVATLSVIWMVGVVSSQILGGSSALAIFNIPHGFSMIIISLLIAALAMLNTNKLSKIFLCMLVFSSLTLLLILFHVGWRYFPLSIWNFIQNLKKISFTQFVGVVATTILVTFIGMDFHQFIVRAQNKAKAKKGIFLGSVILAIFAFLLLALVMGSIDRGLVETSDPLQVIPLILVNVGRKYFSALGILLALPIVFVSVGSGSGVSKIITATFKDLGFVSQKSKRCTYVVVLVSYLIALTGKSIISLIVSFYAIYVASVFIPFLFYLVEQKIDRRFISPATMRNSILLGATSSIAIFLQRFIPSSPFSQDQSTYIMISGFIGSFSVIIFSLIIRSIPSKLVNIEYAKKSV